MGEIALLIFSLCLQAAIGTMLCITLGKVFYKDLVFKKAVLVTAILSVIGVLASLIHLGRPLSFLNSLNHLGGSWLSNEAFLAGIFMGITVLYALVLYVKPNNQTYNTVLRYAGSLVGLATVFTMAKVYATTAVPVWQGINTYVDFYATTTAIGVMIFIVAGFKEIKNIDKRLLGIIILASVIIQVTFAVPNAIGLSLNGMAAQASVKILNGMSVAVGLKWLLILGGAGILMWSAAQETDFEATKSSTGWIYFAGLMLVIGELIGRYVFYAAMMATTVGLT
ncbi:DMSO reductase [Dehalobacter sp. MCB1]|uniref:dimethyl sulfoxide reductase anchor subunit family protein n=1 Tax=unclassified Dehalobacter TaxID=2635733 RepID=UPI000E6BEF2E|nr:MULTISPECIES: DmsC/YnfH family molybdoenzyme membrane anchor subunit [unclassified Dehalobacter]RJE47273.1 DMSO reductase [Dehalobacter sp. MCB1]TCX54873.1 DMSO reductase [Dehalobacter sp. 12DCB1]